MDYHNHHYSSVLIMQELFVLVKLSLTSILLSVVLVHFGRSVTDYNRQAQELEWKHESDTRLKQIDREQQLRMPDIGHLHAKKH